jgi:hypothetical protein
VAPSIRPSSSRNRGRDALAPDLHEFFRPGENRRHTQQAQSVDGARRSLDAVWVGDTDAEHLQAAANPQHGAAAPAMREKVDVPPLSAERREIGDRRF